MIKLLITVSLGIFCVALNLELLWKYKRCYVMTFVKKKYRVKSKISVRWYVRRAETIRIPALTTLLYVGWLPQVNGPPRALLSNIVDHMSAT